MRRLIILAVVVAVTAALAAPALALPGKPDFNDHIFADGQAYGTKVVAMLPTPNGKNMQSFDKLFIVTNGAEGQLPVAEAAPGNSDYNGGRWYTHTATWTEAGLAAHGGPVLLTSYADVMLHASLGHLEISAGPGATGAPAFFVCPLLPVK